jgi:hypothetical protein
MVHGRLQCDDNGVLPPSIDDVEYKIAIRSCADADCNLGSGRLRSFILSRSTTRNFIMADSRVVQGYIDPNFPNPMTESSATIIIYGYVLIVPVLKRQKS